jgi:Flp pilus assembly protein TadD
LVSLKVPLKPYIFGTVAALCCTFLLYSPALHGPFVFDDAYLPFADPNAAELPLRAWVHVRPVLMASYWLNFRFFGPDPFAYRCFNVVFHVAAAILLFFIFLKILEHARVRKSTGDVLALFGAATFLFHPVQTEAVTYVASRSENLSVLLFFAAFVVFLYRRAPAASWPLAVVVLILYGTALGVKEHTVTLPALLLLTDYYWNPGFSLEGLRRNWRLWFLMGAGAAGGFVWVFHHLSAAESAGFNVADFTWQQYFFTQWRAFFVYLRLFLLPLGQTLDYDFPISRSPLDQGALLGLLAILLILGAAIRWRRRYPLASYGLLVCLILLAPTTSVVPIRDPIAERRLYLPMFGLLLVLLDFLRRWNVARRKLVLVLSVVSVGAGIWTYSRNRTWGDATALWEDTVAKSPRKARAHFHLAFAYFSQGRCGEALRHYEKVAELSDPDYRLLVDWGLAYDCAHQPDRALELLHRAARMNPTAHVWTQIAMVRARQGGFGEALRSLETAQKLDPTFPLIYVYRGGVRFSTGQLEAAAADYRRALQFDPNSEQARRNLAMVQALLSDAPVKR